jgi:hypothetical protein
MIVSGYLAQPGSKQDTKWAIELVRTGKRAAKRGPTAKKKARAKR